MKIGFTEALLPEVLDISSEDGRAYAVMAEDGETLVALFPRDELPGGDDEAFQNAFLFLAAPKMLEVIEAVAGGSVPDVQAQCREVLHMFSQVGPGRPQEAQRQQGAGAHATGQGHGRADRSRTSANAKGGNPSSAPTRKGAGTSRRKP